MPIPRKNEKQSEFMQRCMVYPDLKDTPDKQRVAICEGIWKEHHKENSRPERELELRFSNQLELRDSRTVVGTAAPYYDGSPGTEYQIEKNVYERYAPGCFDEALKSGHEVELRYQHQRVEVLATIPHSLKVWSDQRGLHYEAKLNRSTAANDAIAMIENKDIKGSSVGMYIMEREWTRDGAKEICWVKRAALDEISLVTRPAYSKTEAVLRSRDEWLGRIALEIYEARLNTYK
jgi:HK97 family phage prohead protease